MILNIITEEYQVQNTGISFAGLLTLIFITLKLTGTITWSWIWVLAPLWIGFAVVFAVVFLALVFFLVTAAFSE